MFYTGKCHIQKRKGNTYLLMPDPVSVSEKGRQMRRAEARSLLFYWAVRELGLSGTFLAERFGMSQPGVVYAVYKGEKIAKKNEYRLLE